ncbi:MAG: hypothetical protein M3Q75_15110 [Gemmatimonadota bacterium]|nr:hypothetical protein [Gemmatimonadota bacterium]
MNLTTMRDYVRTFLDIDAEDLPNALLDPMFHEAAVRVAEKEPHWPWLRSKWSVSFTAASASLGVPVAAGGGNLREILVVRPSTSTTGQSHYTYIDHDTALMTHWGDSSTPTRWSVLGDTLYLWPTPITSTVVTVDGYRELFTPWTVFGAGAGPDCPESFHHLFVHWALRGAYLQQDDPETASIWAQEFERGLNAQHADVMRAPAAPPLVLNGDVQRRSGYNPSVWDV